MKDAEWIADLLQHGLRHPPVSFPMALNVNYAIDALSCPADAGEGKRSESCVQDHGGYEFEIGRCGQRYHGESFATDPASIVAGETDPRR